ncbi:hypothetical protein [Nonomuraea dietziae]|uniref:hypothetical protein n=1 Tax=Nonomuraea dietziae TaxID=65515 RepID=UPI0031D7FFCC
MATLFAEHDVSIQTVRQEGHGDDAQLVIVTHRATERGAVGDDGGAAQARHRQGHRQRDAPSEGDD